MPGAATQTDQLASAALGPGHPGPVTTPPTLTPSEPACRAWAPLLRPTATLLKLPLRSPPAGAREHQPVLALPSLGAASQKYGCPCPPEAPTYLQKASSAPRSLQAVPRVPASRRPEVSFAQHLLGNLWTSHGLPEYWTSPGLGARHREEGVPWPGPKPRWRPHTCTPKGSAHCLLPPQRPSEDPLPTPDTGEQEKVAERSPSQAILPAYQWPCGPVGGRGADCQRVRPPLCQGNRGEERGTQEPGARLSTPGKLVVQLDG